MLSLSQAVPEDEEEAPKRGWLKGLLGKKKKEVVDSAPEEVAPPHPTDELLRNMGDEKRVKELALNIYDMQGKLKNAEINNRGLRDDIAKVRTDLSEVNETLRNLLCIYEVVTKSTNPFLSGGDDVSYRAILEGEGVGLEHDAPGDAASMAATELLMFSALFHAVRKIENHMESIFNDRMVGGDGYDTDLAALDNWYQEFIQLLELYRFYPKKEKITSFLDGEEGEGGPAAPKPTLKERLAREKAPDRDQNRLLSTIRSFEHYLEKMVVLKIQGKDPSESELEKLDYWYQEFISWS